MSWQSSYLDISPTRLSQTAFEGIQWTFYGLAILMAITRTGFRVYTRRKIDADDCFLVLAVLTLTGNTVITHILYPTLLAQNQVTLGQLVPGPDFPTEMLWSMKLESASANLTWVTIYAVKYGYLLFFRNLLNRVRKMMIWWWIVFGMVTACAISGFIFHWTICPHYVPNFLEICPIPLITSREHVWLIVTTVTDIVSDSFMPVMILWNVKIPLRAKLGIGAALGLSLFMMIIAVVRIASGELVAGVSDTIWIYFCWSLESSTAVFMISATAFKSTFGQSQKSRASKSNNSRNTPLNPISSRSGTRPTISSPSRISPTSTQYGEDELQNKTDYQLEVEEISERKRDVV